MIPIENLTNKELLTAIFLEAKEKGHAFVAVKVRMDGYPGDEIIINPNVNIDLKLKYYQGLYNDDMKHPKAPVAITGWAHGNSLDLIYAKLI
jgi:hypothetical protein